MEISNDASQLDALRESMRKADEQRFMDTAAIAAMQGMLASGRRGGAVEAFAEDAYTFAEALLAERTRRMQQL